MLIGISLRGSDVTLWHQPFYAATDAFPGHERYGLVQQLRRAAVSAPANVAEGYARRGQAEFKRFLGITLGSLAEVDTLLLLSRDQGYLTDGKYATLTAIHEEAGKVTVGLLRRLRR